MLCETPAATSIAPRSGAIAFPAVWTPNSRDAEGHLTSATFGNGTTVTYGYDPATGRMKTLITTATATDNDVLNSIGYTWDQLGNLTQRNDIANSIVENYYYDELALTRAIHFRKGKRKSLAHLAK